MVGQEAAGPSTLVPVMGSETPAAVIEDLQAFLRFGVMREHEWLMEVAPGPPENPIERALGHQFVVFVYAGWEHEYRARLARAHGCNGGDLQIPILGDLRRLRHDVLHHHGIATSKNSGKCEVVGHWVKVGEPIVIGPDEVGEFSRVFPWPELEAHPAAT